MDEVIKKLTEHDGQLDSIAQTVLAHTEILQQHSKTLDQHTEILQQHTERLDSIDEHLGRIDVHLVRSDERLDRIEENMATKDDLAKISTTLDELVGLARKKDEELVFMSARLDRSEDDVEKIKAVVGLA